MAKVPRTAMCYVVQITSLLGPPQGAATELGYYFAYGRNLESPGP